MSSTLLHQKIPAHFIEQVKEYAIFAMDVNGTVMTWNEGAERLKGFKEEEIVGKYYGLLFKEEDRKQGLPEAALEAAILNGQYQQEGWRQKKDGSLFWAAIVLTAVYDEKSNLLGFTKVTRDLSDRKQQEDALTRKNQELSNTNKDLDTFIYTASHDLKAPILNIDALLQRLIELFEKKGIHDPDLEVLTKHMKTSVTRFKSTLDELTSITKLQRILESEENQEVVNVQETYADILADVTSLSQVFSMPCQIDTDFQVRTFNFSRKNFRSILYNLISNAIKYRSQSDSCAIQVKTYKDQEWVVLLVKDNGLGIPKHNRDHLFTMFKRFHDHVDGSGIGLYIIKKIVDNAGGHIAVESEEGKGTEFRIYLKS